MSKYACFDGRYVKTDEPAIKAGNRAFCYGDGLFETIRCLNSQAIFFEKHYQRLCNSLIQLKINLPAEYTENYFRLIIHNLLQKNRIYKGARARLQVFRNEGGFYTPSDNTAAFLLSADELESEKFMLNEKGLQIDCFTDITKTANRLSSIKSCNALLFVMAGIWKSEQGLDEVFILNQHGFITESLASNVFLVQADKLITPSIASGCIDGIMRRTILEIAAEQNIQVIESDKIQVQHILAADEVFLTNAILGISWVGGYKDRRYFHNFSSKLIKLLNEKIAV
jgi:branched-subunit amino acid aminotransferase/4-amino-4-deoxychorismate lyase